MSEITLTAPVRTTIVQPPHAAFETVKVLWVRHWNEHLFSLAVERPKSFRFRSGEFVMLGMEAGGKPLMRAYSIASPAWAEEVEFLSIKVEEGPLTSRLQLVGEGDELYLGRKPTGTLVTDALTPGKRLFLLSTGTGLAPFLSLIRDPDTYERFEQVIVVHSVRRVSDLAFYDELSASFAEDPLVGEQSAEQLHYLPTCTREPFENQGRIQALIENGKMFADPIKGAPNFDPVEDRIMLCGSTAMINEFAKMFEELGFEEGSNARPADFVIERAFVG